MSEMYTCKSCGIEIDWEGSDEHKGTIWSCEELGCGETFCRQCFIDKYSSKEFLKMVNDEDIIRCPDCYMKNLKQSAIL